MPDNESQNRRIYVGLQEGVCTVSGQGETWICGDVTPLAHAAARLTASPMVGGRAYLAAYEAGVYRTDDGGNVATVEGGARPRDVGFRLFRLDRRGLLIIEENANPDE